MTTQMTTQLAPNSMSLPPPLQLELLDGARLVGWVKGSRIGFRGFANENEAAGAAWVAHRTLARRLARRQGRPLPSIDVEPLSLAQDGGRPVILASSRAIATLVLPGADSPSGPDSFGFEIEAPLSAADELSVRSLAHRTYHTLRRSGVRWAMWERPHVSQRRTASGRQPASVVTRRPNDSSPPPIVFVSKFLLAGIAAVLGAVMLAAAPPTVTIPIGMVLGAGLVASVFVTLRARRPAGAAAGERDQRSAGNRRRAGATRRGETSGSR